MYDEYFGDSMQLIQDIRMLRELRCFFANSRSQGRGSVGVDDGMLNMFVVTICLKE